MTDRSFSSSNTYVLPGDEEFAYGIEQIEIKKHVWAPGADVLRGAILHNTETGKNFFVTEPDLARYAKQQPAPDIGLV